MCVKIYTAVIVWTASLLSVASVFALQHDVLLPQRKGVYYNRLLKVLWQITCFT